MSASPVITSKRKRGAQPGNKNALRHGFYTRLVRKSEMQSPGKAVPDQLDAELALTLRNIARLVKLLETLTGKESRRG